MASIVTIDVKTVARIPEVTNLFERDRTFTEPINWITTVFMGAFHVGAVVALCFFTWKALLVAVVLWWVSGSLGIGIGYHRLLTHRSFQVSKWVEYFLTLCGTLALEGGPVAWVATHRIHHQNTDKEGDPHSPRDGGLWAHIGWIITGKAMHNSAGELFRFVPDLRKDKFYVWISKWHWVPLTILGLGIFAIGGWSCLLWGIFFRTVIGLHATWLVNSGHCELSGLHGESSCHGQVRRRQPRLSSIALWGQLRLLLRVRTVQF